MKSTEYYDSIKEEFLKLIAEKPSWGRKEVKAGLAQAEITVTRRMLDKECDT